MSFSTYTWESANLAIYTPIVVPRAVVVVKLWFASGGTGTGNVDMGVYDAAGNAVISAGTAAKAASVIEQVFDVTDTTLGPGLYYIGLSSDSSTDNFPQFVPAAPTAAAFGYYTEASAYPLPATATFAVAQTLTRIPMVGMLLNTIVS